MLTTVISESVLHMNSQSNNRSTMKWSVNWSTFQHSCTHTNHRNEAMKTKDVNKYSTSYDSTLNGSVRSTHIVMRAN